MDKKTHENLRDAGCDEALIAELDALPSSCARLCRRYFRRGISAYSGSVQL